MDTTLILIIAVVASGIRGATPLLLAATGGLYSERGGVVNIALEGIMLFGALTAAVVTNLIERPYLAQDPTAVIWWAPWVGMLAAIAAGGLIGALHALVSVTYKADQIVSGTAINLLALGVPAVVTNTLYGNTSNTDIVRNTLPRYFSGLLDLSAPVFIAFLMVPVTLFVINRTRFGLRLRAVGENPEAADTLGVRVERMRYSGVIISGMLAGLGGCFLSIGAGNQFVRGMTASRGFIALAALIFGKWRPVPVMGAALLFGFAQSLVTVQLFVFPPSLLEALPFVLTMLVLAGFIGRAIPPKAIGRPYEKE